MTRRTLLIALFASMMLPVPLLAHPGHEHKILGVVEALHENHLQVKDKAGKTHTITLKDVTKIVRGKTKLAVTDIKVGDRVVVNVGDGKEPLVAKEVQLGATTAATKR
jgi:hypothetical protein